MGRGSEGRYRALKMHSGGESTPHIVLPLPYWISDNSSQDLRGHAVHMPTVSRLFLHRGKCSLEYNYQNELDLISRLVPSLRMTLMKENFVRSQVLGYASTDGGNEVLKCRLYVKFIRELT